MAGLGHLLSWDVGRIPNNGCRHKGTPANSGSRNIKEFDSASLRGTIYICLPSLDVIFWLRTIKVVSIVHSLDSTW